MKPSATYSFLGRTSLFALTLASLSGSASAESNTWQDGGPSNIWNTIDLNWSGTDSDWDNGDDAIFSGGGEAVTLGAAINAGTITFSTAGYTIDTNGNALNATSILGSGAFTKTGTGALTLSGNSTHDGGITINGGSVVLDNTLGTGAQNQFTGTTGAFTLGASGTLNLKVAGTGVDANAHALTRGITGTGTLILENAGATGTREIALSGTNTGFGGTLNLIRTSGTQVMRVKANQMANTTQISVATGNQFWDNTASGQTVGYTFTSLNGTGEGGFGALRIAGGVTYSGNITIGGSGARIGGAGGTGVIGTLNGQISGGALELLGASNGVTLVVNNNANNHASTTIVSGSTGVVRAGGNTVFGAGTLTQNGAGLSSSSTTARTFGNAYVIGGNVTLGDATNNGKLTFSNTTGLNAGSRTVTTASDVEFAGTVSNGGIVKAGAGVLTLSGASNVLNLNTNVQAGTLNFNGSATLSNGFGSGTAGSSTINVNAAVANSGDTLLAQNAAHTSTFNVNNGGTWTQTNRFVLGNNIATATATLNVNTGGTFIFNAANAANDAFIVGRDLANGTINLNGGALHSNQVVQGDTGAGIGGNANAGTARVFTFDGGTFRALSNNASIAGMTTATINAGGATIDSNGFDISIGQVFGGAGSLNKTGNGSLRLNGVNTYAGATNVTTGTLGGTGSVAGALNVTGTLAPGASIETFGSGSLTFNNTSTFAVEVDSSVALNVASDLQLVNGNLALNGLVNLTLADLAAVDIAFANGTVLSLLNYTGTWNNGVFTFSGNQLDNGEIFSDGTNIWRIDYNATSGGSNFTGEQVAGNFVNLTAVPEPSVPLLGGLGALALLRRRRKA